MHVNPCCPHVDGTLPPARHESPHPRRNMPPQYVAQLPGAAVHASISVSWLQPFVPPRCTVTRIFVVTTGGKVSCRHTKALLPIVPSDAQADPFQYETEKLRAPYFVKVVECTTGSTGF